MRWSALLLVPLFVVACDREPVAPENEATLTFVASNGWEWWTQDAEFPVYFDCIGEELLVRSHAAGRVHSVTPSSGADTRYRQQQWPLEFFSATSTATGHVWLPLPGYSGGSLWTNDFTEFVAAFENLRMENQTTGVILRSRFRMHLVTNAQGEVKVNRSEFFCTVHP